MSLSETILKRQRRRLRVRAKVRGTATRPRLSVAITNRHIVAQLIDDEKGHTLAYSTSVGMTAKGPLKVKAGQVGKDLANQARKSKITKAVFDRGGRLYHGRVKALAEAARKEGLEF